MATLESLVIAAPRQGLGLARIVVRKRQTAELERQLQAHFGLTLPRPLRCESAAGMALMAVGPGAWLAARGGSEVALALKTAIGHAAAVSDQSDAYDILRLTGGKARATLSKLAPIDIHERAFKIGDVAETVAAHMGMLFWRLPDDAAGLPEFDLMVARSLSASFRHALSRSAAEYGLVWK